MGKMKENCIELMDSGVSNLYTVKVIFDGGNVDTYELHTIKDAVRQAEYCRATDRQGECQIYIIALQLRTMRERYVHRSAMGDWYVVGDKGAGKVHGKFWGGLKNEKTGNEN
jgi:hypothetical protein